MTELRRGSCHCGAIEFEVELDNGLTELRRCGCSICFRKGAVMCSVPLAKLRLLQGQDHLSLYQWNTRTARHYFCSRCGIYTHHQRRSNPDEYGVNAACLEGTDPAMLEKVQTWNGQAQSLEQEPTWV
ncbi:MAG: GFA family protein [Rhodospirillaceae bacterium]|nr:GFA family protein [Rhodospirillaceae bacterium]MDE0000767.1 GFA family protein [Rhodospirillaceae bacterium]